MDEQQSTIYSVKLDLAESIQSLKEYKAAVDDSAKSNEQAEKAVKKNKDAIQAEANSIAALREENKKLTAIRNSINTTTAEGTKKIADLNRQLDENNARIKANVDAYTKQKMSIGDYTAGILGAIPGLKGITGGVTGLNAAFKANPIGAVIGILLTLKEVFSQNAVIADKFSFLVSGLNKAFSNIIDVIVDTVSNLDKLTLALTDPIGFFTKLTSSTIDAAKAGYDAAESIDNFVVVQAKANAVIRDADIQIQALEKSLKDKTKSEQERIAIAEKIAALEIEQSQRREDLAKKELENEQLRLKGKTLSSEEEAKLIELDSNLRAAAAEKNITEQQKQTRINILLAKEEAAGKKEALDQSESDLVEYYYREKALAEQREQEEYQELQRAIDRINAKDAARKKAQDEAYAETVANTQNIILEEEKLDAKDQELFDKAVERGRKRVAANKITDQQKVQSATAVTNSIIGLFGRESVEGKAAATTAIAVNTAQGISGAVKAGAGLIFPANIVAIFSGIAAVLAGIAQAKAVLGFADGGKVIPISGKRITNNDGQPIWRSNGDNLLATVKRNEVILNEKQQAALGGDKVFRAIGVPGFAGGGLVDGVQNSIDTNAIIRESTSERTQTKFVPVLVLQDFEFVQGENDYAKSLAKVA